MNYVGEYIRKKRITKKISLDTVCDELKISKHLLQKIENDELDKSINTIFYIGHLRTYANFLNLNTNEIIEQFKLQYSFETVEIIDKIPKPVDQNIFFSLKKFFSFSSIIVIFTTFYFLFVKVEKPILDYAIIPDIPEFLEPIVEKELINLNIKESAKNDEKILRQELEENFTMSSVFASSKIEENSFINQNITLKFIKPTWIQLRNTNNEIVLSQLMTKNDEYTYDLNLKYTLTAGNAGNILVLIDNDIRGKVGDFGEVVDSIVIDSNFNN